MQVFVLLGVTHYEGDTLLGVYATEQAALAAYQSFLDAGGWDYHDVKVEERTVGAPAEHQL